MQIFRITVRLTLLFSFFALAIVSFAQEIPSDLQPTFTESPSFVPSNQPTLVPSTTSTVVEIATDTQTPTITFTEVPLNTLSPTLDITTQIETLNPSATYTESTFPTATTFPTALMTLVPADPPWSLIYNQSFTNDSLDGNWSTGAGWTLAPYEDGFALNVSNSNESAFLTTPVLYHLRAELRVRQTNETTFAWDFRQSNAGSYRVTLDTMGTLQLLRTGQVIGIATVSPAAPDQWRTVLISAYNNMLQVSIDGQQVITFQDAAPLPPGIMAFSSLLSQSTESTIQPQFALQIDDLYLWMPSAEWIPTPTYTYDATVVLPPVATPNMTQEATPQSTVTPAEETLESPTLEATPDVTPEMTPEVTSETTPEVTPEITPEVTPEVIEDALPSEPPLTLLFSDNFDAQSTILWSIGENWSFVPNEMGQALHVSTSEVPTTFIYDNLYNTAFEARVSAISGGAQLHARLSDAGQYTARLQHTGELSLLRGDLVLNTAFVAQPSEWHLLRLSVIEDVIRVSVDGTEIIAVRDGSPLPPGLIGFSGYNLDASGLRIDDFSLWLPSEDIAETPAVTPTPTPTPTLETLPPEPELMLMVEDNFDTADLSQWSAGAAWTFISSALVPMLTQDTEEEIVSLPEATAELSMEEETPTVEAAPPESTDVFVEEGQSLQGISGDSPLSLNYRPLRNLVVQADVSVGSGTVQFSIRQSELGAYQLTIHPDGSVELFRNDVLVRAGTMPPQGSLWQSVRLAAIENGLRVSIDNVDVITFVDSNPLPEGNIAFSVLQLPAADLENPDAVYLDNFKLWIPTNEIPAPALTDEPPLQILFSDNFDSGSLAAWTLDTYWISDYSASSLAVENRTSGQGAYLLENELYDAAAEITFYVSGGMADVRLRETEAGAYIARFNPAGEVSLYRGEVLLQSVPVVPSQPWEWRRLRLSAFGNTIRVAVDGVQVIEQLDETPLESGLVSFAGYFPSRDSQSVIRVDTFEVWIASETASSTTPLNPEFPDALEAARQPLEAMSFGLTSFQSTTPPIPLIGWVAYTDWEGGVDREEIRIADVTDNNGETDVGIKVIGRPGSMEVEPAISPDGTRIAFASDCLDNFEIYVLDLTGWNATVDPCAGSPLITPLTDTPASVSNTQPVWSPDGTRIAFISNRPDTETQENIGWKIYIVDALSGENALSGEDAPRLTPNVPSLSEFEPAWSPDGREIAYRLSGCGSDYDIYRATAYELLSHGSCVALQDPENGLQLIAGPGDDRQPAWSPDGRLLAYSAFRSSNTPNIYEDIYVVSTNGAAVNGGPAGGEINLTSPLAGNSLAGGSNTDPSWSPDMKTIAFVSNFVSGGYATRIHVVDIIDVIYGSSPSTVQLTFNPVLNARSAHGFWVRFGSPDWSQYLTCNDGKDAADERTDSLTNTLVTPLFYQRLACLTRYSGVAFMAIYHETNENRSIDFNEISSLVAGSNLADPYISAFDNANSAYDHRYMFSVSVVNGLVRTARTTDPAAFLSNNYFCTAVLRECEDDTLGSDNDRDGDGNYVEAGETDTAGNPLDPTASAPGNIFDVFDGNPGWLAGSFAPQCVEEDEITVPNTLCLDANWYYRLMITWGRATVSATDLSPLYPRWNEAYREILPYMRMAMFDEVLAEVNQLDIVRGGSEVKDANRLGTDLLGEPITITVLTRWFVSEGHTITSQYMTHLDELFFVQAECVVPIALRDGVPPMVSDGDPPRVSPRVTNLRGGTQYPLRNAIRIGLSNDSLYIHLLVPEYNNNGAITALTWKTTVFQFGISVEDGLVNGIAPVNLQSSGFEFLISQVRPQPVTCP